MAKAHPHSAPYNTLSVPLYNVCMYRSMHQHDSYLKIRTHKLSPPQEEQFVLATGLNTTALSV